MNRKFRTGIRQVKINWFI